MLRLLDGFIDNMKFRVEFTVNRLPLKLQHRAVHMAVQNELRDVLFPVGSRSLSPAFPPALRSVRHICTKLMQQIQILVKHYRILKLDVYLCVCVCVCVCGGGGSLGSLIKSWTRTLNRKMQYVTLWLVRPSRHHTWCLDLLALVKPSQ